MRRRSGRRCSRGRFVPKRRPISASAGRRRTATSSTSIICPRRRGHRGWCCFTVSKAAHRATTRLRSRKRRGPAAGISACRIFAAVPASPTWRRAAIIRAILPRSAGCSPASANGPRRRCWQRACRWAATRCCAGRKKPVMALPRWRARSPRSPHRSIWPPPARRSTAASIGWPIRRHFLRTMKPSALAKLARHPGLFDRDRLVAARTLARIR